MCHLKTLVWLVRKPCDALQESFITCLQWAQEMWTFIRCLGAVLTLVGAATFVVALALPFVRIAPGEKLDPVVGPIIWFLSDDDTYTLFGSIIAIWNGNRLLGGIAFTFSLVVPSFKLSILGYCVVSSFRKVGRTPLCQ
jgi:hypothetical protein